MAYRKSHGDAALRRDVMDIVTVFGRDAINRSRFDSAGIRLGELARELVVSIKILCDRNGIPPGCLFILGIFSTSDGAIIGKLAKTTRALRRVLRKTVRIMFPAASLCQRHNALVHRSNEMVRAEESELYTLTLKPGKTRPL